MENTNIVDRAEFYEYGKPDLQERTKQRLTEIAELGMVEVNHGQFGYVGVMSGLYIEKVWNYSDEDFKDYMDWAKSLINKKITKDLILETFNITDEVLAIYPYGSIVYGNNTTDSDADYIVVMKASTLPSGAFKQNAISSKDRKIQVILYSRGGFTDAINNYEIGALECLSLPDDDVIYLNWNLFKINKWSNYDMVKNIIKKISDSWYSASNHSKNGNKTLAKKGIYHALRILMFAIQLKEHKKIIDFTVANNLKNEIMSIEDSDFDDRKYLNMRDELIKILKN